MLALAVMAWHLRPWRFAFVPLPPALAPGSQRLARRQAVNLSGASGLLTVLQGQLWLTRDGDPADYVLAPGDRMTITAREGVVIQSFAAGQGVWVHWSPARPQPRYSGKRPSPYITCSAGPGSPSPSNHLS